MKATIKLPIIIYFFRYPWNLSQFGPRTLPNEIKVDVHIKAPTYAFKANFL